MKSRNFSLLFIFVFCFLIVMFCQTDEKEIQGTQSLEQLAKLIHVSGDAADLFNEEVRAKLLEAINNFRNAFQDYFNSIETDYFPKSDVNTLLQDKHVILEDVTKVYHRVSTGDQYCRLLREAKEEKARSLEATLGDIQLCIVIKHITVDKIEETRFDHEGEQVNMIARVIFKYHILGRNGSFDENTAGGGSGEFLHRRVCTWF